MLELTKKLEVARPSWGAALATAATRLTSFIHETTVKLFPLGRSSARTEITAENSSEKSVVHEFTGRPVGLLNQLADDDDHHVEAYSHVPVPSGTLAKQLSMSTPVVSARRNNAVHPLLVDPLAGSSSQSPQIGAGAARLGLSLKLNAANLEAAQQASLRERTSAAEVRPTLVLNVRLLAASTIAWRWMHYLALDALECALVDSVVCQGDGVDAVLCARIYVRRIFVS